MKSASNVVIIEQDKACTTLAYCMAYSQRSMDSRGFLEWITHLVHARPNLDKSIERDPIQRNHY